MSLQDIIRSAAAVLGISAISNPALPAFSAQSTLGNQGKFQYSLQLTVTEQRLDMPLEEMLGIGRTFPHTESCPAAASVASCIKEAKNDFVDDLHDSVRKSGSLDVRAEGYGTADVQTIKNFLFEVHYAFADGRIPLHTKLDRGLLDADKLNDLAIPDAAKKKLVEHVRTLLIEAAALDDVFRPIEEAANEPISIAEEITDRKNTYDRLQRMGDGNGSDIHKLFGKAAKTLAGNAPADDEYETGRRVSTDLAGFYIQRNIVYAGLKDIFAEFGIQIPDSTVPIYDTGGLQHLLGTLVTPTVVPNAGIIVDSPDKDEEDSKPLPSGKGLVDILLGAGIPEEAIVSNHELWAFVSEIEREEIVSANKVFHVAADNGEKYVVKVTPNVQKARVEAAANYYLGRHFWFIVPGKFPEPLQADDLYVTIQKDVGPADVERSTEYWVSALALFHRDAAHILKENNVKVPRANLKTVEFYTEQASAVGRKVDLGYDRIRLQDALDYLHNSPNSVAIHRDLKRDNIHGSYLVDLESVSLGDPAIDLALLFMQRQVPEEGWDSLLRLYVATRGVVQSEQDDVRQLHTTIRYAAYATAVKEILGSSERDLSPHTARENSILARYLRS